MQSDSAQKLSSSNEQPTSTARAADWIFLQPAVLDEMHEAVIVTDLRGTVTACNRAAQAIYGYTPQELIGKTILTLYSEEDRQTIVEDILPAVRSSGFFRGELRNRTRSGDYVYVHLAITLLKDAEGNPAAMAGFSVDVTSQKLGDLAIKRGDEVHRQFLEVEAESTILKITELALRKSNQRLSAVLSSMTEGLVMLDREWRYTYCNQQASRMLGTEPDSLLGRYIWDVFPDGKNSRFREIFHQVMETRKPRHFDEFYPEPLNKWFECHCYPSEEGLSVYFRDITERQEYVASIVESERRARLGLFVATLGLAEINYSTGLNHLSPEAAHMFGLGEEATAVPRETVHATFHPDDRDELATRIAGCLDPKGTGWFSMDHRVVWPDGQTRWLRVRKQVYFTGGEDRHPERAMLAAFDVTEEHRATERIQKSELRFRNLAESLPQMIWESEADGTKVYCNQKYLQYTGCDSVQELTIHWHEFIHPEDRERTSARWQHSLATGEPYLAQYRLKRANGEYRHFLAQALPVRNSGNEIERWLGTSTDIHEQKLAEEVLRRSEMLAAAGKLAASVAHEINNPLAALTNLLYIMDQSATFDPANRQYLAIAQEELARVSEIATQALGFHRQSVAATPTRIDDLLEQILKLYGRRILSCGLTVIREYGPTEPLTCLAGDIRQALSTVLANAVEASRTGGRLKVRLRSSTDWKTRQISGLRITIADTGEGIPKDYLAHIFQPFFSTKGITHSGLGLWIARDLLSRCGGTIRASASTSDRHQGTVVSIFLPYND